MILGAWQSIRSLLALAAGRARAVLGSDRRRLAAILALGLLQGLFYLAAVPPWKYFDEANHFEYAWLVANGGRDDPGAILHIRRELAASMTAHRLYPPGQEPLLGRAGDPPIGVSQLADPPLYYLVASLPLRLLRHQDLVVQLYAARLISLLCFLATLAIAVKVVAEVTDAGHPLRWAVPLCLACLPPFVDVMTSLNNDVAAVLIGSLFWWGGVRVARRGVNGRRLGWLAATAVAAALTKNTVLLAPALLPWVLIWPVVRRSRWRWRLAAAAAAGCAIFAFWGVRWNDAAFWYRRSGESPAPTRALAADGAFALELALDPKDPLVLAQPLASASVRPLRGRQVTVGAWLWADRSAVIDGMGVALGSNALRVLAPVYQPVTVTATPTWQSWTTAIPTPTNQLQVFFSGRIIDGTAAGGRLFVRAPVLVEGDFAARPPIDYPPPESGEVALSWAGRPNLLRNPGADQRWPHVNPTLNRLLDPLIPNSPQGLLSSLADTERTQPMIRSMLFRQVPADFFLLLAWGGWRVGGPIESGSGAAAALAARLAWLVALAGGCRWLIARRRPPPPGLALLGLGAALSVAMMVVRAVPLLQNFTYASVRYAYPAAIPLALALVGGWRAIAPGRARHLGPAILLAGMALLNLAAIVIVLRG